MIPSDEEREVKPKKRRKRTKELPKEDSSDDEQDVLNGDVSKRVPRDEGSSSSVSPPPQQRPQQTVNNGSARRRKRTKALKDKTYMNDEGFMVTEKVYEIDSTDASDEELQETNPPENEKQPSPAKKIVKKTCVDMKNKPAKQSSLTSFFKKS